MVSTHRVKPIKAEGGKGGIGPPFDQVGKGQEVIRFCAPLNGFPGPG